MFKSNKRGKATQIDIPIKVPMANTVGIESRSRYKRSLREATKQAPKVFSLDNTSGISDRVKFQAILKMLTEY